jgi:hypothetical protein
MKPLTDGTICEMVMDEYGTAAVCVMVIGRGKQKNWEKMLL